MNLYYFPFFFGYKNFKKTVTNKLYPLVTVAQIIQLPAKGLRTARP